MDASYVEDVTGAEKRSGEETDKLPDPCWGIYLALTLVSATRSLMEDSKSTPILEDSKWAWHPEVKHPNHDRKGVDMGGLLKK